MQNKDLKRRILEISYKHNLSHLGSCLTAVDIIEEIYQIKKPDERFVLSASHSALALYVVLEYHGLANAEELFLKSGVHADRLETRVYIEGTVDGYEEPIACSGGSLGQAITIACGMALSDRTKNVWVLTSDGEMEEGSCWETLKIKSDEKLVNLKWFVNANGYGAYKKISTDTLEKRIHAFCEDVTVVRTSVKEFPVLKGLDAHYYVLNHEDYNKTIATMEANR